MIALLLAAPLIVSGASVRATETGLQLQIETSGAPTAAQVGASLDTQGLVVTLTDADLVLSEQRFGEGVNQVRARRTDRGAVSLELPIDASRGCASPRIEPGTEGVAIALACTARAPEPLVTRAAGSIATFLVPLLLVLVALGAWLYSRKRPQQTRLVEVLETASLGPKRALVVVRVGRERLVLGSSEAGITVLSTSPDEPRPEPVRAPEPARSPMHTAVARFARHRDTPTEEPSPFAAALEESTEDLELQRKLARGLRGVP